MSFTFKNWGESVNAITGSVHTYGDLLVKGLGRGSVVLYHESDGYEGDWSALLVRDGEIGLVDGYFGSCSGCDSLQGCYTEAEYASELQDYLKSVRTFSSWEDVFTYLEENKINTYGPRFGGGMDELIEFARLELRLEAADIFVTLREDDPEASLLDLVKMANALN